MVLSPTIKENLQFSDKIQSMPISGVLSNSSNMRFMLKLSIYGHQFIHSQNFIPEKMHCSEKNET